MKKDFFVVAAMVTGSQLQAQLVPASRDRDTTFLDEVVITANKFPNKTSLTGKVVTIITKEQLERSGGKDLSQLLSEQAGVYIGGANSNAGKDKSVYLRGARIDHTLVTIDGVPVYDASGIGSNFDIRNISIASIERIEILKGSQSTLYGSDAIAGVINIITKKIIVKSFSGNGLLSYGSNKTFRGNAVITGKTGIIDYNVSCNSFCIKKITGNIVINNSGFPSDTRIALKGFITAIAGVINIITKKIIVKSFSGNGLLSYGSNKTFKGNAGITGKTGIIDYNVSCNFFDTKGINEAASNATNADKDGFKQNSLQTGLGIQAGKNIRIQPYLRYSKMEGDIDQGTFTDELDYTYTQKSFQAGVRNEFAFGKTKLNVLYNHNHIDHYPKRISQ